MNHRCHVAARENNVTLIDIIVIHNSSINSLNMQQN
jgi:hypothetical protein